LITSIEKVFIMDDRIVRGLSAAGGIRVLACTAGTLAREICALQQTSAPASIALGRGLAGGILMGALLKQGQRVALKFEGNGPLGKLIIEADSDGAVRGCVGNPAAEAPPLEDRWNIPGIIGRAGFLTVSRDLGLGGEPYRGMVQLRSSEIGDDLAYYLTDSEQVPSAVGLGATLDASGRIAACGGFLAQTLPRADKAEIEAVMAHIESLPPLSELVRDGGPEALLAEIFGIVPYTLLETHGTFFRCGCSREKVERALLSLGPAELDDMCRKKAGAEVSCEFCRRSYHLDTVDIEKLIMKDEV
jgi:molecular chaperone Hsp33